MQKNPSQIVHLSIHSFTPELEFNQGMLVHSNPENVAQLIAESLPE